MKIKTAQQWRIIFRMIRNVYDLKPDIIHALRMVADLLEYNPTIK